ncbi:hypothetical protein AAHB34_15975 [Paenarthrobacter ureafaciens]
MSPEIHTERTMLQVLNEHHDWAFNLGQGEVLCVGCNWSSKVGLLDPAAEAFRAHQADALTAAGFASAKATQAQTLRDASDAYPLETAFGGAEHAVLWLKQRAKEIQDQ